MLHQFSNACILTYGGSQIGEGAPYGVDINTGGVADSFANFVWEPAVVKVSDCFDLQL